MKILIYIVIGFCANMIDGTLGMAYGVVCRTLLKLATGVPADVSSAVVHVAELPATLVSGIAHLSFKNVIPRILFPLIITGVLGGVLGAYIVTNVGGILDLIIAIYLLFMGLTIFCKAFKKEQKTRKIGKGVYLLGAIGGFCDATGGGGWGPVVGSTLIGLNDNVKKSIGTVNIAEFCVTLSETTTFIILMNDFTKYTEIIGGLITGGVIAAPLAALVCKKIHVKHIMIYIGLLIMTLNVYELYIFFT